MGLRRSHRYSHALLKTDVAENLDTDCRHCDQSSCQYLDFQACLAACFEAGFLQGVRAFSNVYSELAYQLLAVMRIVVFECHFQLFHGILEVHKEFLFADIDDTVSRSHTSVLLKHTQNKLERLFAFVIIAASGCLFYHCCGSPHGVSRDHFSSVNLGAFSSWVDSTLTFFRSSFRIWSKKTAFRVYLADISYTQI